MVALRARILHVGRTKSAWVNEGVSVFVRRLRPLAKVEIIELKEARGAKSAEVAVQRESAQILHSAAPGFVLLDERGTALTSVELAQQLGAVGGGIDLVVGGAYGVTPAVRDAAGSVLSLSKMTLTHDMAKLLLVEQVYRAATILGNGRYHH
eukprot:COSAG01_NODE_9261_length_2500_cov_3.773844_2_plen_152_part_00